MNSKITPLEKAQLRNLDRRYRLKLRRQMRHQITLKLQESLLMGFILGLFSLSGSMFVPLIGLLLSLLAGVLSLIVILQNGPLWRSLKLTVGFLIGFFSALTLLSLIGYQLIYRTPWVIYLMIACSSAALIVYNFFVAFKIWGRYQTDDEF